MVGYRDVKYTLDSQGAQVEEKLPEGAAKLCAIIAGRSVFSTYVGFNQPL